MLAVFYKSNPCDPKKTKKKKKKREEVGVDVVFDRLNLNKDQEDTMTNNDKYIYIYIIVTTEQIHQYKQREPSQSLPKAIQRPRGLTRCYN
jgi:ribosome biogenesis protein Tsr3